MAMQGVANSSGKPASGSLQWTDTIAATDPQVLDDLPGLSSKAPRSVLLPLLQFMCNWVQPFLGNSQDSDRSRAST